MVYLKNEILYRKLFNTFELTRSVKIFLNANQLVPMQPHALSRDGSLSLIANKCILSGRSRAVYRKLKVSRLFTSKLFNEYSMIGLEKAC